MKVIITGIAKQIAKSLNLNEDDYDLACRCALFHDISRFKQWTDYSSFEDSISFDHGDEGYNILKELGIDDEIVLLSTKYHNKYEVPSDLDDRTKLFCNITRDADKLDIMIEQNKMIKDDKLVELDEIYKCFEEHKLLRNGMCSWNSSVYHILRNMAFIFDMVFDESLRIVKEKDVINNRCDLILSKFDDERIKNIKEICNKYINERISD